MKRKLTILSLAVLLGLMSGCAKKAEIGAGGKGEEECSRFREKGRKA